MSVFVSIYKHTKIVYLLHEFPETTFFCRMIVKDTHYYSYR